MTNNPLYENSIFKPYPRLAPYAFLITAIFIVYFNALNNAFLFDDGLIITLNDYLKTWDHLPDLLKSSTTAGAHIQGGFYRPLQMVLYLLVYQIQGPIPFGFHLINIILHAVNTCLIYRLGKKLNFKEGACFFAALLWGLHPIHTEAVTYMSGTADPLFTMFCLAGSIVLLPDFSVPRVLFATLCMILGCLSKETAAIFPLLAVLVLFMAPSLSTKRYFIVLTRLLPMFVLAFLYSYWRIYISDFDGPLVYNKLFSRPEYVNLFSYSEDFFLRLWTFFASISVYVSLIVWPRDLHMERNFPVFASPYNILVGSGILGVVMALAVIMKGRLRFKPMGFGLLWFGISYAPNTGLLYPVNALLLEHWMYCPTAGLILGCIESIGRWSKPYSLSNKIVPVAGLTAALLMSATLGFLTYSQNKIWKDPITFYSHILQFGDTTARVHNNLALAYIDKKDFSDAIVEFHKAINISDNYAETHHNLAIALLNLPNPSQHTEEAIAELIRATEIDRRFYRSYGLLAMLYAHQGNAEKANFYREKTLQLMEEPKQ